MERHQHFDDVSQTKHPADLNISNSCNDHEALVTYTFCKENEEQPVPLDIQCLVVLQPTKSIPSECCYLRQQLKQILLPSGLQHIAENAFFGCCSLKVVVLPISIKSIGQLAFEGCSSLATVSQEHPINNNEEANQGAPKSDRHLLSIGRSAMTGYKTLRKIVSSLSASTIDDAIWYQAFKGCKSLQSFIVPTYIKALKERAFEDCHCLSEIHLPDTLTQMQFCAFKNCKALERIEIPPTVDVLSSYLFLKCTALVDVTLSEGLKRIGNFAFAYCSSLETIRLPSTVKLIERGAFSSCESLVNTDLGSAEVEIHVKAFQDCSSFQRLALPSANKMLHSDTFGNCTSLVEILLPEGLTGINNSALRGCRSLRSIALPKSLKRIHPYAMSNCTSLVSVEIPKGAKMRLSRHSFQSCEALTNIAIPSSMVKLLADSDANFFSGCILLELQYAGSSIFECLEHRFENFPVHELCYYASTTTREELEKEVRESSRLYNGDTLFGMKKIQDVMGMTPFHVLLSASTRRLDLLEVLLDAYPATALLSKDENGISAIYYLISNWTADAKQMMRQCLQKVILDPLRNWGLESWRKHMEQVVDSICTVESANDDSVESKLVDAMAVLSMYKKLELTSLLEQWLWKMNVSCNENKVEKDATKRAVYRATCGASFVIPIVRTFLDDATWKAGF